MMDQKADQKMAIHQLLVKNGFYRLPMQTLSQILRLLDMPQSIDPKGIQQNTIGGLMKVLEKVRHTGPNQNSKYAEYVNQPKYEKIPKDIKEYVLLLLEQSYQVISNKYPQNMAPPIPPAVPPGMPPGPMYPPMYNPMGQMPYPPARPMNGDSSNPEGNGSNRYMEEAMRMQQQMYMYYYSLYQNGYNPMMNPQMGGMNAGYMGAPYGNYGMPMPNANNNNGKAGNSTQNNSMPYGQMGMGMGMGPMPEAPPMPNQPPHQYGPPQPSNTLGTNSTSSQQGGKLRDEISALNVNQNAQKSAAKEQPKRTKRQYNKKSQPNIDYNRQTPAPVQKSEKKKIQQNVPQKINIDQPFIIGERVTEKQAQKQAPKILTEANPLLKSCACKGFERHEQTFLCSICNRTFHYFCLNEPIKRGQAKQNIECYHCRMRFIDPLNKVKEVIIEQYITNISDNKISIVVNLKPFEHLVKNKNKNQIEMRCLKVSHLESNQITWPDECVIKLNGERIIEIPALQLNSSLKKRKDYSIIVTQNIYNKATQNDKSTLEKIRLSLEIKNLSKEQIAHKKIRNNYTFAFAIYFIEKLSIDELYDKIINQQKMEEIPDYISKLMRTSEKEVQINKISVSIYDPYTWDLIKMPVRGNKCQHGQCFDLRTFISFMMAARNRSWKCPVCNKDARKFMVDRQQLDIIKRVMDSNAIPTQITFMKEGNIVLKIQRQSDNQEESSVKNQKSKKIIKSPKRQKSEKEKQPQRQLKKANSGEEPKKMLQSIQIDLEEDEAPPAQQQASVQQKENVEQKLNNVEKASEVIQPEAPENVVNENENKQLNQNDNKEIIQNENKVHNEEIENVNKEANKDDNKMEDEKNEGPQIAQIEQDQQEAKKIALERQQNMIGNVQNENENKEKVQNQ